MLINEINQANQNALVGSLYTKEQVIAILQMVQVSETEKTTSAMNLEWLVGVIEKAKRCKGEVESIEVDLGSAEMEMDYNNCVELTDVTIEGLNEATDEIASLVKILEAMEKELMSSKEGEELLKAQNDDDAIMV
ncbi:MAG: hypothetical protein EBZ69_09035 [Alphaproteobacteria bacterium]|nr:hypothetical protein [Alphaproteobacteria bacterium]NDC56928.1 hypothetical protein [Alphaproteobacteria bacterium]